MTKLRAAISGFFGSLSEAFGSAEGTAREVLILKMTVLVFLIRGFGGEYAPILDTILAVLGIVMILSERSILSVRLWWTVLAVMVLTILDQWYVIDNHKYLLTYWVLACTFAVWGGSPSETLRWNGRMLVGLAFTFALFWKFAGGELVNGSFFHASYLLDERFRGLGMMVGGMSRSDFLTDGALLKVLQDFPGAEVSVTLISSSMMQWWSLFSSWWVLLIEGLIASSFLLTAVKPLHERRDLFLLIFIGTTYFVAPVDVFAMTLAVLGLAQCDPHRRGYRAAYVIAFALLPIARLVPSAYSLVEIILG